ncbi:MAG: DUF2634 domain-containing protein [Oscillospiraceae bacterium]|nr:DUF2634 domain-containing protein [Oscillospiraceae bacterium]
MNFVFDWDARSFEMDGGTPREAEGREAVEAWAAQMLHIRRGRLEIMPKEYGTSAEELIGRRLPYHYRLVELEREISEACGLCPEIISVSDVAHEGETVTMKVHTADDDAGAAAVFVPEVIVPPIVITAQPEDAIVNANENAYFTVTAEGEGIAYQWQYKSATGTTWADTTLVGNKSRRLTVAATSGRNGFQYRCVLSAGGVTVVSEPGQLLINGVSALSLDDDVEGGKR